MRESFQPEEERPKEAIVKEILKKQRQGRKKKKHWKQKNKNKNQKTVIILRDNFTFFGLKTKKLLLSLGIIYPIIILRDNVILRDNITFIKTEGDSIERILTNNKIIRFGN